MVLFTCTATWSLSLKNRIAQNKMAETKNKLNKIEVSFLFKGQYDLICSCIKIN